MRISCDGQGVTGTVAAAGVKPARGVNNKNPQVEPKCYLRQGSGGQQQ
jgi:hypothetical protein